MRTARTLSLLVTTLTPWLAVSSCSTGESTPPPRVAQYVDSAIGRDESLRRFRADLADRPTVLEGGETSRDALVHRFVAALATSDTPSLARMALTRAEFAYLFYETSPQSLPPYDLGAGLLWFQMQERNRAGIGRALKVLGGRRVTVSRYRCRPEPERQGDNLVWIGCTMRLGGAVPDGITELPLFGAVIERAGRFKFLSYSNKL
ncbi:MAG: hypothetical protein ABJD07_08180 [Gemmatimonadaceae bacterium]